MPPKMMKTHHCQGKNCTRCKNPRVILLPFLAPDSRSEPNRYHFTSSPATTALFNKPDFSDLRLAVGDVQYYAHRLILCAASDVFSKMLGSNWSESQCSELVLHEDENCTAIFQQFLFYLYSGSIMISEAHVVPLFMLADKYNVKLLYDECVKVIKNGLKVYVVHKFTSSHAVFDLSSSSSESSSESDSSEENSNIAVDNQAPLLAQAGPSYSPPSNSADPTKNTESADNFHLIASEAFPLTLVIRMLTVCQNERILHSALYNLEVRLGKQISHSNFAMWNDLQLDLLTQILSDDYFMCEEHMVFRAAKSWLSYSEERKTSNTINRVLRCIRYPLLHPRQLYEVERDPLVTQSSDAMDLIREAMRYQLFRDCVPTTEEERWSQKAFQLRKIRREK